MSSTNPDIETLVNVILLDHFPNPPARDEEIRRFEETNGWRLDDEMRAFYSRCNGASLFQPCNSTYRLLALEEIVRARIAIFGEDVARYGPDSWYVVCDNLDGDYTAVNVANPFTGCYSLYDVFHETFPDPLYTQCVAKSFSEFLMKALASGNMRYWLSAG